jgi:hypothetical protein
MIPFVEPLHACSFCGGMSKLFWARDSRSEMQLRDVRNLLTTDCDVEYLRSRAEKLNVDDLLKELLRNE